VPQLTQLKALSLRISVTTEGLLQLTQLRQLTYLQFEGPLDGVAYTSFEAHTKVGCTPCNLWEVARHLKLLRSACFTIAWLSLM
jgi:hypothetical protein